MISDLQPVEIIERDTNGLERARYFVSSGSGQDKILGKRIDIHVNIALFYSLFRAKLLFNQYFAMLVAFLKPLLRSSSWLKFVFE